jgi:phosphonate transport system substrate-binding protein
MRTKRVRRPSVTSSVRTGICIALLVMLGFAVSPAPAQQKKVYTIAVIPSAPPVVMHTQWMPLVERVARETGLELRLKVYDKMSEFEEDIWGGGPDFIFASPIQTVVAHEKHNYTPLVRGREPVAVRLFVRNDSSIRIIDDLAGKRIAFVGNKNLCSVFVRHMLDKQQNKLNYMEEYTGSTKNVIKSVLIGKNDAGAVFVPELERETGETRDQMRGLFDTPKIAPHPLSAHPRVPKDVQDRVKNAVLAIARTTDGAELVKNLRLPSPVAADYERDYQMLEEVDVIGLTNWGH